MPETPIDVVEGIDRDVYNETKDFVKPELVINSIYELHELLALYYGKLLGKLTSDQREALSDCLQAMRKEFVFGGLTHLRGHTTDGQNYRRKAVEFCAFGILILRSPHDATIWLEAIKSNTKFNKYKNRFRPMAVMKTAENTGIKLTILYEELCKEVHASAYAIKTQSRIFSQSGRRVNYLNYHDDWTSEGQLALAQSFVTAMNLDFFLLVNFGWAIKMHFPDVDMEEWKEKVENVREILISEGERISKIQSTKL